jgi:hypothetical protein
MRAAPAGRPQWLHGDPFGPRPRPSPMRGRGRIGAARRKSPVPRLASEVSTQSPMRGRGRGAARRKSPVPRLASEVSTQSPNPGEAARQRACEGPTPKLSAAMSTPDAIWGINDHGFGACPLANPPVVSQVDAAVNTQVFSSRPDRGRAGASRPGRSGNVPSYVTGRREFGLLGRAGGATPRWRLRDHAWPSVTSPTEGLGPAEVAPVQVDRVT